MADIPQRAILQENAEEYERLEVGHVHGPFLRVSVLAVLLVNRRNPKVGVGGTIEPCSVQEQSQG
jgi:hypothetical protein